MKTEELIALAIGGIALWMMFVSRRVAAAPAASQQSGGIFSSLLSSKPADYVVEIENTALPGQPGWGWQYFSNGAAIGPNGAYYYQGQQVAG